MLGSLFREKSVWSDVLRGKYQRDTDFVTMIQFQLGLQTRSLWKVMVKLWPEIVRNSFWSIGNGKNIDAWKQNKLDSDMNISELSIVIL